MDLWRIYPGGETLTVAGVMSGLGLGDLGHGDLGLLDLGGLGAGPLLDLRLLDDRLRDRRGDDRLLGRRDGDRLGRPTSGPGHDLRGRRRSRELLDRGVAVCLRFDSSTQLGTRIAVAYTPSGEVPGPRGTPVTLCIGAANRDPEQFEAPQRFDIAREPNRHLAFGFGIHQCAGLSLARLEARIAIGRFVARFPGYRLVGGPVRASRARFRGFVDAPVAVV